MSQGDERRDATYYEVEQDGSQELRPVEASRFRELQLSGRGKVTIAFGNEVHRIAGSRHLTNAIGYLIDGVIVLVLNDAGTLLRTYVSPAWVEGNLFEAREVDILRTVL